MNVSYSYAYIFNLNLMPLMSTQSVLFYPPVGYWAINVFDTLIWRSLVFSGWVGREIVQQECVCVFLSFYKKTLALMGGDTN